MSDQIPAAHDDHQKWHWKEGNKYAIEAIKTLLLLNGGTAVALLAFLGNWKGTPRSSIASALVCFGVGALSAAIAFIGAYETQLQYGKRNQCMATIHHVATRLAVSVSSIAFCVGLYFAWRNLPI